MNRSRRARSSCSRCGSQRSPSLGWFVQRELVLGTDLRLFLPSPTTPEQRLLLEEIGEGPASRVLVIALEGAAPSELADASRALADALRESERFRFVTNGETSLDALPESLLAYRYLLSPTLDTHALDADYLRTADRSARSGSVLARRRIPRTLAAARSHAGAAEGAGALAAHAGAAP